MIGIDSFPTRRGLLRGGLVLGTAAFWPQGYSPRSWRERPA